MRDGEFIHRGFGVLGGWKGREIMEKTGEWAILGRTGVIICLMGISAQGYYGGDERRNHRRGRRLRNLRD